MKALILIFLVFTCGSSLLVAQNYYLSDTIYCGNEKYFCSVIRAPNRNSCTVRNIKNKLFDQQMKLSHGDQSYYSISGEAEADQKILGIFREIMSREEILKMNEARDRIHISFFIIDSGKVLELMFNLYQNTTFSPKQLVQLEQLIKERVTFTFSSNAAKGSNFLFFNKTYWF